MIPDVGVRYIAGRVVGEDRQPTFDASILSGVSSTKEVDIFGEPGGAVRDDGEPADKHIARVSLVQRSAEADDVLGLWCPCVRRIISCIHVSASSKLTNR